MATLGERIRSLRKERKLTLVELAGNKMTKGMLSLIENNKATPSMENLTYIADQLNVPMSELLGDQIMKEKQLLVTIQEIIDEKEHFGKYADKVWELYNPRQFLSKQISGARLAVYFGKSAYYMNEPIAPFFNHAEEVYKGLHAADLWVDTVIARLRLIINDRQYEEAISFLSLKEKEMKELEVEPTPMRLLEWYFYLAAIQFAIGEYDEGMGTIEKSLALSKEHHIYYMMNQLLRTATAVEMMTTYENYKQNYLHKLKQYTIFSEDDDLQVYVPFIQTHYYTTFARDIQKARTFLQQLDQVDVAETYIPFLHLEWGKIFYYEENYEAALEKLLLVENLEMLGHPVDQSVLGSKYTYVIRLAQNLGKIDLVEQAVEDGKRLYEKLPDSFYKEQFFETIVKLLKFK